MQNIIRKLNQSNTDPSHDNIVLETQVPPSSAWFHLSSHDRPSDQPITNFVLSKKNYDKYNLYNVNKIGLSYVNFPWPIPPINPRNSELTVEVLGVPYTGFMSTGYYTYESFATALNTMFAGLGMPITISATITSDQDGRRILLSTGIGDSFTPIKSTTLKRDLWAVIGLDHIYGIQFGGVTATLSTLELWYTRTITIVSDTLGQFNPVNDEGSTSISPNVITKLIDTDITTTPLYEKPANETGNNFAPKRTEFVINPIKWFDWEPNTSISSIDIRLVDDFGDPVYLVDPYNTPDFDLVFLLRALR
jgi:hypothetical protein